VSWLRLDGSFSQTEQDCVRSRINGHRFAQLQGDVTLARVALPAP
jgi:hypothetical protein